MADQRAGTAGDPRQDGSAPPSGAAERGDLSTAAPSSVSSGKTLPSATSGRGSSSSTTSSLGTSGAGLTGPTGARRPRLSGQNELVIGDVLADRYQVLERLSAGGMGVVYKARHVALDDLVALKLLLKPQKEEDQKRFLLEARLATKIKHPNTVYISDFGVLPDGRSYLAMEFLRGQTLAQAIQQAYGDVTTRPTVPATDTPARSSSGSGIVPATGASDLRGVSGGSGDAVGAAGMDPLRVCRVALQIARGLHAVHEKGIVHRDLKPENVFLVEQNGQADFVKIVDFGIAKVTRVAEKPMMAGAALSQSQGQIPNPSSSTITRDEILKAVESAGDSLNVPVSVTLPGSVMGTPAYMSPEAIDGRAVDARADQYSLGCVLFEMLTGHTPFRARSAAAMLMKHLSDPPPALGERRPPVPASLEALVRRLLSKQAEERYASMNDVAQALEREIELMQVARGERTVLPSALAGAIGGRGLGTTLLLAGRRVPLVALLPLALLLVAMGGFGAYYLAKRAGKPRLNAGELLALRGRALEVLRGDLGNRGDAALRLGAATGLGYSQEPSLRPALESVLAEASAGAELQAQAATALGQLGERGAVAVLEKHVGDAADPQVRTAAAAALRLLGSSAGEQTLVKLLDNKNPEAQFRAALLLCEHGPADAQGRARELLKGFLGRDGVPDAVRLDIWACLVRTGDDASRAALQAKMQAVGPAAPRLLAASRLAQLGDGAARQFLGELVRKKDPEQLLAARLLAGPDEPGYRDLFRGVVAETQAAAAARVLGSEGLGATGEAFDARLLGTLLTPETDAQVRQAAATAILQIAAHDPSAWSSRSLAWAKGALSDRDWLVRQAAVEVLGASGGQDAVALLAGLLKDADARIRRSAAKALGRRHELAALLALRTALEDVDPAVRQEALRSMARLVTVLHKQGVPSLASHVEGVLRGLLAKGDKVPAMERLLALGILARLGDKQLHEQMLAFKDTHDPEVRRLFIEQLEGHPELLAAALSDPVAEVRFAAARKLAELGDGRAESVLREFLAKGGAKAVEAYGLLLRLGAQVPSGDALRELFAKIGPAERAAAVAALGKLSPQQALPLLWIAARDPASEVRRQAADTASELPMVNGQWAGLPVLRFLAGDGEVAVRARAQALLDALSSPSAGESAATASPDASASTGDGGAAAAVVGAGASGGSGEPDGGADEAEPKPAGADGTTGGGAGGGGEQVSDEQSAGLEGEGLLALKGPEYVQLQIDQKRWQYLPSKPIKLPPGTHQLVTMSGKKDVVVAEKKTTKLEVAPSPIEEAAHGGIDAYGRKDYGKAQKLLERAYSRCERARGLAQPCANLTVEMTFYLGQVFEEQGRLDEAATQYQMVADASTHGRLTDKQRSTAVSAIAQLSKRLGLVVIQTAEKSHCKEKKIWLPPGQHRIKVGSERKEVKVRERETVTVGSCG